MDRLYYRTQARTRPWPSWLAWPGTARSGSKQSSLYRPLTTFLQDYSVIAAEREIMPRFFFVPSVRQHKFPFSFLCRLSKRWITMQWTQITVVFLAIISSIYFVFCLETYFHILFFVFMQLLHILWASPCVLSCKIDYCESFGVYFSIHSPDVIQSGGNCCNTFHANPILNLLQSLPLKHRAMHISYSEPA